MLLINYKAPYLQARPNYQNVPKRQHIATSGHYLLRTFGHHVAATCCDCDVLGVTNRPLLHGPGQTTTTSCNIHKYCIKNWAIYKLDPATPNMSKHADDPNISTQHCCVQLWRVWSHYCKVGALD